VSHQKSSIFKQIKTSASKKVITTSRKSFILKMEMNHNKPVMQFDEGLCKKKIYITTSINYLNLKVILAKKTS